MPDVCPTPGETAENITRLLKSKILSEAEFREMHHMGRSAAEFQKYCGEHSKFICDSRNHQLAIKLREMLARKSD